MVVTVAELVVAVGVVATLLKFVPFPVSRLKTAVTRKRRQKLPKKVYEEGLLSYGYWGGTWGHGLEQSAWCLAG